MKRLISLFYALIFTLTGCVPVRASAIGEIEARPSSKATYMATSGPTTLAASCTDFSTLTGSASKTIKILKVVIQPSCTSTGAAAAFQRYLLIKRSTADSGGTSSAITAVPLDSTNSAATAAALIYTANPAALGTAVGTMVDELLAGVNDNYAYSITQANQNGGGYAIFDVSTNPHGQAIVLRGTSQQLCLNLNATTQGGTTPVMRVTWIWTEE